MPRTRVAILGSTGSIGQQAIEVALANPESVEVIGLVAGRDETTLRAQADRLGVTRTGLGRPASLEIAAMDDADVVLNAIVGAAGLEASVTALAHGKKLALANKESMVAGGDVCIETASRTGALIVPIDSEHAALAHCLEGRDRGEVDRLVLTASGGPFRERHDLAGVTPADALAHPTWDMGPKITIDSATMMNKGLEVIEAHYLFGFGYDRIDVVVHPQSIVHGMIAFADGSMLMEAAPTDMRIPIQAALLGTRPSTLGLRLDPTVARFPGVPRVGRGALPGGGYRVRGGPEGWDSSGGYECCERSSGGRVPRWSDRLHVDHRGDTRSAGTT